MDFFEHNPVNRRDFIKRSAAGIAAIPLANSGILFSGNYADTTKVAVIKTENRIEGINTAMKILNFESPKNRKVVIKPNFNTADPAPAGTHNDALETIVKGLWDRGASSITLGERSGPPDTNDVITQKGVFHMAKNLDFEVVNYLETPDSGWAHFKPNGTKWEKGFTVPKMAVEADYFVSTCCLKTHGYGGVFTMSLKLAVGLTPKKLMRELHGNRDTWMRHMIADINQAHKTDLVVMDGIETFVDGGPSRGKKKKGNVIIAGTDRIAVDATGVAVLKELGSNDKIMGTKIFAQEQIERAVDVGLGVDSPSKIEFVTADSASKEYADKLKEILLKG